MLLAILYDDDEVASEVLVVLDDDDDVAGEQVMFQKVIQKVQFEVRVEKTLHAFHREKA